MNENKKICTRCGYRRREADDSVVPDTECPKCGIVYQKFEGSMLAFDMIMNEKRLKRNEKIKKNKSGYILMLFIVFVSLFVIGFISGRTYTKYESSHSMYQGQSYAQ